MKEAIVINDAKVPFVWANAPDQESGKDGCPRRIIQTPEGNCDLFIARDASLCLCHVQNFPESTERSCK
jgi:hypothetical protein